MLLEAVIHPQHGYPFLARHQVRYELWRGGRAARGPDPHQRFQPRPAPFVLGAHPYFTLGGVAPEDLRIQLNADSYLTANERMIPTGTAPRLRHASICARGKAVPESLMDTCFTDLLTDDGVARHTLSAPDGRSVSLWHDASVSSTSTSTSPRISRDAPWPWPWNP